MKIINSALVSRKKGNESLKNSLNASNLKNNAQKMDDFNNIVFSGTAKRKTVKQMESPYALRKMKKGNFEGSLMKLRAPFYKHHKKQVPEKLMTKSCETLLECIKPYKDICVAAKTKVKKSAQTIGKFLTITDIIYEWKATRKVQFLSFSDEKPIQNFFMQQKALQLGPAAGSGELVNIPENENEIDYDVLDEIEISPNQTGKTISSEDFITSGFSKSVAGLI